MSSDDGDDDILGLLVCILVLLVVGLCTFYAWAILSVKGQS